MVPQGSERLQSARRYTRWDIAEPLLRSWGPREPSDAKVYAALSRSKAVFYTPTVGGTLREFRDELDRLKSRTTACIEQHIHRSAGCRVANYVELSELLVIDEAERLSPTALEYVRDMYDRIGIGVILIGMPGIEKSLSRYPQLYSRVGFAHHYRPLKDEELSFVLTQRWHQLGLTLDVSDFTDTQAIASIVRVTGGNFRLLHRLFVQIERVLKINELCVITDDMIEAARSTLVIGAN